MWKGQRPSQFFTITSVHLCKQTTHAHARSETSKPMHSPYSFYTAFLFFTYNFKLKNRPLSLEWDLIGWFHPFYLLKQIKPCGVRACDIKHSGSCCGYIDKCKRFSFLSLVHTPGAAQYCVSTVVPVCSGTVGIIITASQLKTNICCQKHPMQAPRLTQEMSGW